jgi:hypothetical protein
MFEVISVGGIIIFVLFIVFSVWANVYLLRKLLYFTENIEGINNSIDDFNEHLQALHELPMFYGDENIKKLIDHSGQLKKELSNFREAYRQ